MRLRDLENINEPPPVPIPPEEKTPESPKPEKKPSRKLLPWLAAAACVVALLGIWIGTARGKPEPTDPGESIEIQAPPETTAPPEPWKTNILRSDEVPRNEDGAYLGPAYMHSVFGSAYERSEISSVTFLSTLSDAPEDTWDVSEAGDGSVKAWVEPEGDRYRLCIAGEGGVSAGRSCRDLFAGYLNVQSFHFDGNFHTDTVENMNSMFHDCIRLTALDLSSFDTAKVEDMKDMFNNCYSMTALDLSGFDTAKVEDMSWLFNNCNSLTTLDLTGFDTAKVEDMSNMFNFCNSLTTLDLNSFDTTNVRDMYGMFSYCDSLTSLDLSSFDTAKVEDMGCMFYNCESLTSLDLSGFDTAKVEDMGCMFRGCYCLTDLNLSSFDTANVRDMSLMFYVCDRLTSLDLSDRFVSTNADTHYMFDGCPAGDDWGHLLN